jgi:hypothetical protein
MAWIYIPDSTSSTVSADTADSPSDSDSPTRTPTSARSPISNGTSTASGCFKPGSKTAISMTLPSGTTSSPLTADPGVGRWIFSVLASRVNRIATPDSAGAPQMIEIFFPIRSESLGRWDQDSSSWRTSQASLWEVMDGHHMGAPWSESWPRSGMTRNGELYPLPMLERPISETGGGSWRTPTAADWKNMGSSTQVYLSDQVRPSQVTTSKKPGVWHIPTPTSADVYTGNLESSQQSDDSMHSVSLPDFVNRWPTPTSTERSGTNPNTGKGEGLSKTAKMFPTPVADGDRQTNYAQGGTSLGFAARLPRHRWHWRRGCFLRPQLKRSNTRTLI